MMMMTQTQPAHLSTGELIRVTASLGDLLRTGDTRPNAHVMVVEDDANLLEGVCAVLEISGYRVTTAVDGSDALAQLQHAAARAAMPDLIVSDIMMPNMDGIAFLQSVRQRPDWVNIPFIFLTALSEKADIQKGKQLGVDDYVIKPFEADDLVVAVESRLQRHRALSAVHSEQMSNLKRRILTILNHEFRTPLTFVVAYSDLLNTHTAEAVLDDSEILSFLKGVNSGAVRLRRLIENFILLVELDTGDARTNYDMRKAIIGHVSPIIERAITMARDMSGVTNPITAQVAPDVPAFIGDADYLKTALVQLIENAAKFSPPNAVVEVGARTVMEAGRPAAQLYVCDHGRGIPEPERPHIWDTFYQINRAVHEDQGAGSGLAIVRGIAALHSAATGVNSEVGQGSTFTLTFPAKEG